MSYKKEVIAQMRLAVLHGMRASSETIEMWAKLLEQDEQQTPPSPDGQGCSGESSVQPGAIAICMHAEADLLEVKSDGESLSASMSLYGKAIAYREIAEKAGVRDGPEHASCRLNASHHRGTEQDMSEENKPAAVPSVDDVVTEASEPEGDKIKCWCGAVGTFGELFDSEVFEQSCGGSGYLRCECGGDFCVCHHHGEVECGGCEDCDFDDDDFDDDDFDDDGYEY